ncbi:hypothetical protein D9757_009897 [Collybiopsis confluens]|uniref:Uncharacterized protein n=1 Tax=Collybiopsis confluens TaxID=2823264 RepID=A0A8H5GTH8_9AGAR|nr:hypothetical protein D9757_009897 [Collybiopsis confluens]
MGVVGTARTKREHEYLKQKQPLAYRDKDVLPREIIQTKRGSDKTLPRCQIGHQALTDQLKEEFIALKTKEERASWIESKRQKRAAVEAVGHFSYIKHAKECNDWYSNMLARRRIAREAERGQAIKERLTKLGLKQEVDEMDSETQEHFHRYEAANGAKPLRNKEGNMIKPELVRIFSYQKNRRLKWEKEVLARQRREVFCRVYEQFMTDFDYRSAVAHLGDVLEDSVCQELIIGNNHDTLADEAYESRLVEFFTTFVERWTPKKVQEVLDVLQNAIPTATVSDLHLATSVFICTMCVQPLAFPEMFHHLCCYKWHRPKIETRTELQKEIRSLSSWNCDIRFSAEGSTSFKDIVKACGLDPLTTTTQDMYATNPLVECLCGLRVIGACRVWIRVQKNGN